MLEQFVTIGKKWFFKNDTNKTVFYKECLAWGDVEYGYVVWDGSDYISKPLNVGSLNGLRTVDRYGTRNYFKLIKCLKNFGNKLSNDKTTGGNMFKNTVMVSMQRLLANEESKELEIKEPQDIVQQRITWQEIPFLFEPKLLREEELDWSGAVEVFRADDPFGPDILYQMGDGHLVLYSDVPLNAGVRTYEPVKADEQFLDEFQKLIPVAAEMFQKLFQQQVPGQRPEVPRRWNAMRDYFSCKIGASGRKIGVSMEGMLKETVRIKGDLQSKLPKLVKRYLDKGIYISEQEATERVNFLSQADPTGTKGDYIDWVVKLDVDKTSTFPEDIEIVRNVLEKYIRAKNLGRPIDSNIFSFKDYGDLASKVEEVLSPREEHEMRERKEKRTKEEERIEEAEEWFKETGGKGIDEVYADGTYTVYKITNAEALTHLCWLKAPVEYCIKNINWAKQKIPFWMMFKGNDVYLNLDYRRGAIWNRLNQPATADEYWGDKGEVRQIILGLKE